VTTASLASRPRGAAGFRGEEAVELDGAALAHGFAEGMMLADARSPTWGSYRPGLGPHPENETVKLIMAELALMNPTTFGAFQTGVSYPNALRQRCDLLISPSDGRSWAIEVKMLRFMGDNGKPNDNMLMHILSPYAKHRSALTDCQKLVDSGFEQAHAILIYGYDYDDWPMEPAVEAFEQLARYRVGLGPRHSSRFGGHIHPVHQRGQVFVWDLHPLEGWIGSMNASDVARFQ
jgi:hypothetical protein